MFSKRTILTFATAALIAWAAPATFAQTTMEKKGGWGARAASARPAQERTPAEPSEAAVEGQIAGRELLAPAGSGGVLDIIEREKEARRTALTGTWRIQIPKSNAGLPPFNAYHTFNIDGTFTEVSDLLPALNETPAHGVWQGEKPDFQLTFELFVFDEQKTPAGIVRVRNAIRLADDNNSFTSRYEVDFIAPDGTVEAAIDTGTYTGTRVKVIPVR